MKQLYPEEYQKKFGDNCNGSVTSDSTMYSNQTSIPESDHEFATPDSNLTFKKCPICQKEISSPNFTKCAQHLSEQCLR